MKAEAILFDLDGTLVDTAPDLAAATNRLRAEEGHEALPLARLRPFASSGGRGMLQAAFGLSPADRDYSPMLERLLAHYADNLHVESQLFDGMAALLDALDHIGMPWGIVTNKKEQFTTPLVASLGLLERARCVVSGDSAPRPKPAPDPLLLACEIGRLETRHCVYVGDDLRDIVAGRAAGMRTIAAAYGYLGLEAPIEQWQADLIIHSPAELHTLLKLEALVRDSI